MNWDAVSAVGEVIGAGAVVGTLVFLSIQVRDAKRVQLESNRLARSAAGDKAFDQFTAFRRMIAADSEVARSWRPARACDRTGSLSKKWDRPA
jgi:hypothetical protein